MLYNKPELVTKIAEDNNCTKIEAKKIIEYFTNSIYNILADNDEVKISGFGAFKVIDVKAKTYRHPATGKLEEAAASKRVKFVPSVSLAETIGQ